MYPSPDSEKFSFKVTIPTSSKFRNLFKKGNMEGISRRTFGKTLAGGTVGGLLTTAFAPAISAAGGVFKRRNWVSPWWAWAVIAHINWHRPSRRRSTVIWPVQ